jgi:TetR/AcrR family transcriptional regulator
VTMRRPRERDSRGLLEEAARSEFAEFGYAGARVERIARRAGVNKQLVFYYFGSKEGLYDSIVDQLASEVTQASSPRVKARHPSENLREMFFSLFDSISLRSDLPRLLILDSRRPARSAGIYDHALSQFIAQVRTVVLEGQRHGYFRDDVDPDLMARQALILAVGYAAFDKIVADPSDPARARAWRNGSADLLVKALAW